MDNSNGERRWINPVLLGSVAFLVFAAVTLVVAASRRGAGAPVYCDSPVRDFGDVPAKTKLQHVFDVVNRSNTAVDKLIVAASCSRCSSVSADATTIPVGGRVQVHVTSDAGDKPGPVQRNFVLIWKLPGESETHRTLLAVKAKVVK